MFDKAGALVSAKADLSAHLVGTQAGGKKIDLHGSVKLDGNAHETAISFTGSGIVGDLVVNEANGSLTLATNKATFVGVLDVAAGRRRVRFERVDRLGRHHRLHPVPAPRRARARSPAR